MSNTPQPGSTSIDFSSLGLERQVDCIDLIIRSLDEYIATVSSAREEQDQKLQSNQRKRDRVLLEQEERRTKLCAQIEEQYRDTVAKIESKRSEKKAEIQRQRQLAESMAKSSHQSKVAGAKKELAERVWLADTLLETEQRKEDARYSSDLARLDGIKDHVESMHQSFMSQLSRKVYKRLSEEEPSSTQPVDSTDFAALEARVAHATESIDAYFSGGILSVFWGTNKRVQLATSAVEAITVALQEAELLRGQIELQHIDRVNAQTNHHQSEVAKADHTQKAITRDSQRKTGERVRVAYEEYETQHAAITARFDGDLQSSEDWKAQHLARVNGECDQAITHAKEQHDATSLEATGLYESTQKGARAELVEACVDASRALAFNQGASDLVNLPWEELPTSNQPTEVPRVVRFMHASLDLTDRLNQLEPEVRGLIGLPDCLEHDLLLPLPGTQSLLIRHDVESRDQAIATLRCVMTRIIASFPARKARFVIADPVGIGQSFAGFMRLSDLEPSPVGQKIWADPRHIESQLVDVTEHMQTVIQKYLRTDYATIEEYNEAAGEVAEPYRFVVIADLEEALTESGAARLKSILDSGPRCGVYALIASNAAAKLPEDLQVTLETTAVGVNLRDGVPSFDDPRTQELTLATEDSPPDALVAKILDRVAVASAEAGRVEVPFERLAPDAEAVWSRSCSEELVVPLGRSGAQKIQEIRLGKGTRQHALIAGRTGSGKSTLLHVMITAAGMWYDPSELEMYLIDFKKGVEFKAYAGGRLPHVRAVAIESDREFGLSVLKRLDQELIERGELFRKLGAQDLASARERSPESHLPRVLLLIDEFQEFFTEDDEVASEASLLLDRLVRQGRAFGIHVVLGSQTLSGAYSLARSTLGQIGVRIALQCSEADSYLILGEENNAARLLERPGEAIYNNAGGLVEGNSPFQTAWLPDADRDEMLSRLPVDGRDWPETIVFEGNKPAKFDVCLSAFRRANPDTKVPKLLLGDSVAIAPPTAASLNKRSGANLLIVSPQSEPSMGILLSASQTFCAYPGARVVFIDPTPEDDSMYQKAMGVFSDAGVSVEVASASEASRLVSQIHEELGQRDDSGAGTPTLLVLAGVHRLRSLRKSDDYGFSLDDDQASPDKELASIIQEGPPRGIWVAAWCDTLTNLERFMERSTVREFGLRALMQMSASDSTMLMDSSAASTLGANRAIYSDEVSGKVEKFRPIEV